MSTRIVRWSSLPPCWPAPAEPRPLRAQQGLQPLGDEERAVPASQEYDSLLAERSLDKLKGSRVAVRRRHQPGSGPGGAAYVALSLRTLQQRNLCRAGRRGHLPGHGERSRDGARARSALALRRKTIWASTAWASARCCASWARWHHRHRSQRRHADHPDAPTTATGRAGLYVTTKRRQRAQSAGGGHFGHGHGHGHGHVGRDCPGRIAPDRMCQTGRGRVKAGCA